MRVAALGLSLLLGTTALWAQDAPRDTGARGALPGPNATPPGAEAHPANASNAAQPVPGAMPASDTVPSLLSAKNAADDKQTTLAYTFKNLSPDERTALLQGLNDPSASTSLQADVGMEVPRSVMLHDIPDQIASRVPQTRGYQYAVANGRVYLVDPVQRVVVAVLSDSHEPLGQGPG